MIREEFVYTGRANGKTQAMRGAVNNAIKEKKSFCVVGRKFLEVYDKGKLKSLIPRK